MEYFTLHIASETKIAPLFCAPVTESPLNSERSERCSFSTTGSTIISPCGQHNRELVPWTAPGTDTQPHVTNTMASRYHGQQPVAEPQHRGQLHTLAAPVKAAAGFVCLAARLWRPLCIHLNTPCHAYETQNLCPHYLLLLGEQISMNNSSQNVFCSSILELTELVCQVDYQFQQVPLQRFQVIPAQPCCSNVHQTGALVNQTVKHTGCNKIVNCCMCPYKSL